jgi:S1-C subfamily serine protease
LTIGSVAPLSPAWEAGLQPFDTITRIADVPVSDYSDLLHYAGAMLAGAKLKLHLSANNITRTVDITLGKYRHDQPFIASVRPEPVFGLRVDHGTILAQRLFNRRGEPEVTVPIGVCVREILADSPAAMRFKALGDDPTRWIITHVNGVTTKTPADFLKAAKGQANLRLSLQDTTGPAPRNREISIP